MARDLTVPAWGIMNVANALGVFVLLREFGLSDAEIAHGLASFKGVARRQELIGEAAGVTVIDDFAHHPRPSRPRWRRLRSAIPAGVFSPPSSRDPIPAGATSFSPSSPAPSIARRGSIWHRYSSRKAIRLHPENGSPRICLPAR